MSSALLLCDLWDEHWCATAAAGTERIAHAAAALAPRMRAQESTVIHGPSDTMAFYAGHPARQYVLALRPVPAPALVPHAAPPQPAAGPGCPDQPPCREPAGPPWPWTRQHPAIGVAPEDAVVCRAEELFAVLADRDIEQVYVGGVHTNICIMDRPFGIRALVTAGISCALIADLTEAMPAAHTAAALEYVERFWCPLVTSDSLGM